MVTSTPGQLSRPGVSALQGLLRDAGAPRGAAGRHRGGESPPLFRRHHAARHRHGPSCCPRLIRSSSTRRIKLPRNGFTPLVFGETLSTAQVSRTRARFGARRAGALPATPSTGSSSVRRLERAARDDGLAFKGKIRGALVDRLVAPDDHPLFARARSASKRNSTHSSPRLAGQAERAESIGACLRRARELQEGVLAGWTRRPPTELGERRTVGYGAEALPRRARIAKTTKRADPTDEEVRSDRSLRAHGAAVARRRSRSRRSSPSSAPEMPARGSLTSATLSVRGDFYALRRAMGLNAKRSMTLPRPFRLHPSQGPCTVPRICRSRRRRCSPTLFRRSLAGNRPRAAASSCCARRCAPSDRISADTARCDRGARLELSAAGSGRCKAARNCSIVFARTATRFLSAVRLLGRRRRAGAAAPSLVVIDKLCRALPDDPVLSVKRARCAHEERS